jgi:hypothetical protein
MKITIPKPCHENWENMTPDEKGRFCAVCSKTVRDFSKVPDDEIIGFFQILRTVFAVISIRHNSIEIYITLISIRFL